MVKPLTTSPNLIKDCRTEHQLVYLSQKGQFLLLGNNSCGLRFTARAI